MGNISKQTMSCCIFWLVGPFFSFSFLSFCVWLIFLIFPLLGFKPRTFHNLTPFPLPLGARLKGHSLRLISKRLHMDASTFKFMSNEMVFLHLWKKMDFSCYVIRWCGENLLWVSFPSLYAVVASKGATMGEVWETTGGEGGGWNLRFIRPFDDWEMEET